MTTVESAVLLARVLHATVDALVRPNNELLYRDNRNDGFTIRSSADDCNWRATISSHLR